MQRKVHSLGFQALNQARIATHARDFFAGYKSLIITDPKLSMAFGAYSGFFSLARKAMRELAIVNVASVLDKQETSTGMFKLITEVEKERLDLGQLCNDLRTTLLTHRETYCKAVLLRSNIVAHRSRQMTYKEVHDKADLEDEKLSEAINIWRNTAQELSITLRGTYWHPTSDAGEAAGRLLRDIAAGITVWPDSPS